MTIHIGFLFISDVNCHRNVFIFSGFIKNDVASPVLFNRNISSVLLKWFCFIKNCHYSTRKHVTGYHRSCRELENASISESFEGNSYTTTFIKSSLGKKSTISNCLRVRVFTITHLRTQQFRSFLWKITGWIWLFLCFIFVWKIVANTRTNRHQLGANIILNITKLCSWLSQHL